MSRSGASVLPVGTSIGSQKDGIELVGDSGARPLRIT